LFYPNSSSCLASKSSLSFASSGAFSLASGFTSTSFYKNSLFSFMKLGPQLKVKVMIPIIRNAVAWMSIVSRAPHAYSIHAPERGAIVFVIANRNP